MLLQTLGQITGQRGIFSTRPYKIDLYRIFAAHKICLRCERRDPKERNEAREADIRRIRSV